MYDRVLIAVDGSEAADRAARRGLQFAAGFDADVDVVYVVERKRRRLLASSDEADRLRERGEAVLSELAELAATFDRSITTELAEGAPAAAICEYADRRDADAVVVGRQGRSGLGARLFGGVTERVLHRSDVPVLVVPTDDRVDPGEEFGRVLVPTDGSETAERAGRHGAAVAERYGAPLDVLYVVDIQSAGGVFDAGGLDEAFLERLDERGREAVDRLAADVAETAPDVTVETSVVRSSTSDGVADGVREHVAERDVDLVVMGSHGRSNLERQLLGSVAATLIGTVDVPVLVVPRRD